MVEDRARIDAARRMRRSPAADLLCLQTLLDHVREADQPDTWNPCLGGYPEHVLRALHEQAYPLEWMSRTLPCQWMGYARSQDRCPVSGHTVRVGPPNRIPLSEVKARLRKHGSVVLEVAAETLKSTSVRGRVVDLTPRQENHAVCVVGWKRGCWIVRNSWGGRRVPTRVPDTRCVTYDANECTADTEGWNSLPDDPGFALLPMSYRPLHGAPSPWIDAEVHQCTDCTA